MKEEEVNKLNSIRPIKVDFRYLRGSFDKITIDSELQESFFLLEKPCEFHVIDKNVRFFFFSTDARGIN